jgi:hypothetical protein
VFAGPAGLLDGAEQVGDPIAVLPVLFHLLWRRELRPSWTGRCTRTPWSPPGRWLCDDRSAGAASRRPGGLRRETTHLVVGLAGTSVRLRADAGGEQVVLAGHLMAAADFAVLDNPGRPVVEPFGLLESLPAEVVAEAERWRDHLSEVGIGLSPGAAPGTAPRARYERFGRSGVDGRPTQLTAA